MVIEVELLVKELLRGSHSPLSVDEDAPGESHVVLCVLFSQVAFASSYPRWRGAA